MQGTTTTWRLAIAAALLAGGPARAEQATLPSQAIGDPIVVTGKAPPAEERVRALARAISPRLGADQPLARFSTPVCIATAGLARNALQAIGSRMAFDAVQAGISLAGDGCNPNVVVLFTDDGRGELADLVKRRPLLFDGLSPVQIRAILDEPGPVHVWARIEVRARDGDRLEYNANGPPNLRVPIASMVVLPTRRDLVSTVIVIDRKAVAGRSTNQVADYAALRTLAVVRPLAASSGDTILTLFQPNAATPPGEMTAFDRGYLKALYEGAANQRAPDKLAMIVRRIATRAAVPPAPATDAAATRREGGDER